MRTAFDPESAIVNEVSIFGLLDYARMHLGSLQHNVVSSLTVPQRNERRGFAIQCSLFFFHALFFRIQLEPSARD